MRSTNYIDRLNKTMTDERADYMKKIEEMARTKTTKRWCMIHPTSNWSLGFPQCTIGFQKGERCVEGDNEQR